MKVIQSIFGHELMAGSEIFPCLQLGQLLETDMVPPAVMRTKLQIGGRMFALGTMLHYVPDIRTLTHEGPKVL